MSQKIEDYFWARVDKSGDCWIWIGPKCSYGYGEVWFHGRQGKAHRWAYVATRGAIPDGLQLDHLCRNRLCARPSHLEAVTAKTNLLRGEGVCAQNARKSHCKNGHALSDYNLTLRATGGRACKACQRERQKRYLQRKAAA